MKNKQKIKSLCLFYRVYSVFRMCGDAFRDMGRYCQLQCIMAERLSLVPRVSPQLQSVSLIPIPRRPEVQLFGGVL
ncbi:hypothetical protein CL631_02195 [bacterium]|nr:hypothetical protein [bacterium]